MSMVNLVVLVLFPLTQVGGYSLLLVLPVSTTVGCACGVQYCYPPLVLVSSTAIHRWYWYPVLLSTAVQFLTFGSNLGGLMAR